MPQLTRNHGTVQQLTLLALSGLRVGAERATSVKAFQSMQLVKALFVLAAAVASSQAARPCMGPFDHGARSKLQTTKVERGI
jgi:hypothetical protein